MPFKSEAQRKYLWANEPEIARDWTDEYGSGIQAAHGGMIGSVGGISRPKYQQGNMVGEEMEGAEMEGAMMQSQEVIKELYDALIAQGLSPQEAMEKINNDAKSYRHFACMESNESTIGLIANLIIGELNVPVGFVYKYNSNGFYEMSFRARYDSNANLGQIVSRITTKLGGMGGGHKKACGARIPEEALDDFIRLFKRELNKTH